MYRFVPMVSVACWLAAGCAHTAESHETTADRHVTVGPPAPAPPGDNLQKFDLALRLALQGKTEDSIGAIALLSRPIDPQTLAALKAAGLIILSARDNAMHVRGDAQALLQLAARPEVVRLAASNPVQPLPKEPR